MLKRVLASVGVLGVLLASGPIACAHETTVATAPAPEVAAPAVPAEPAFAPALWAVRDADSTIYLYGTIHLRRPGAPWADAQAQAALAEADEVWTEIQIDPAVEAGMAPLVQAAGLNPPGQPLSSRLTPQQNEQLGAALASLGLPAQAFEPFRPWLAGVTLVVLQMTQAGFDPQAGVDRQVDAAAEAAGKTMRWFETPEEQIGFLSGLSEPVQLAMLVDVLKDIEGGAAVLERLDAGWASGDIESIRGELIDEMRTEYPELYDALLTQRNAAWVEVLSQEMAGSGVDFVAVGLAHLIGEESVVAMMQARGFTVERVVAQ